MVWFCNTAMVGNHHDKEMVRLEFQKLADSAENVSKILFFKITLMLE
jgi:hypothetical protein